MPLWISIPVALLIGFVIWRVGIAMLRSMGGAARGAPPGESAEDVQELALSFVCRECGTELRVAKFAGDQIPRHCGERMQVVRRPRP